MRTNILVAAFVVVFVSPVINGQAQKKTSYDLSKLATTGGLKAFNREPVAFSEQGKKGIRVAENENDGLAWINGLTFGNGTIEVDLKGRNVPQKSFIGIAFHGADESTMDIIYFRPFNFKSTDSVRKIHAVQYVSEPDYGWKRLRDEQNGKFEKGIVPPPDGDGWFHAKIVVHGPQVSVFVNGNAKPSLTVEKLNPRHEGKLGLWVGPQSTGEFANLVVEKE